MSDYVALTTEVRRNLASCLDENYMKGLLNSMERISLTATSDTKDSVTQQIVASVVQELSLCTILMSEAFEFQFHEWKTLYSHVSANMHPHETLTVQVLVDALDGLCKHLRESRENYIETHEAQLLILVGRHAEECWLPRLDGLSIQGGVSAQPTPDDAVQKVCEYMTQHGLHTIPAHWQDFFQTMVSPDLETCDPVHQYRNKIYTMLAGKFSYYQA